jgi:hypothetical protein
VSVLHEDGIFILVHNGRIHIKQVTNQRRQQRALARSNIPNNADKLSFFNVQVEIFERYEIRKTLIFLLSARRLLQLQFVLFPVLDDFLVLFCLILTLNSPVEVGIGNLDSTFLFFVKLH